MVDLLTEAQISIVVPAYNSSGVIEETIGSLLNQSFHDQLNTFIVDDRALLFQRGVNRRLRTYWRILTLPPGAVRGTVREDPFFERSMITTAFVKGRGTPLHSVY